MRNNLEAMKLSRRTVIASLAAGAAASVPIIAAVAGGDHPDAELLELGREYGQLREAIAAANARHKVCAAAFKGREPVLRDVMRHRITDHVCGLQLPILNTCRDGISCDDWRNDPYSEEEIALLRDWPARDPAEKARAAEIVAEWDRWTAEWDGLEDEVGVTRTEEAIEELVRSERSLIERIAAIHATTIAGQRMRAMVLVPILAEEGYDEEDYDDHLLIRAIVRDLSAMPDQSV
jgi:hypothetical protein